MTRTRTKLFLAACSTMLAAAVLMAVSDAVVIGGALGGVTEIDMPQQSTPANPPAGTRTLFVDSGSGELSVRTSAGSTVSLESAGGASFTREEKIYPAQLDSIEAAAPALVTKTGATAVDSRARAFSPTTDEYSTYWTQVPADLAASGNVVVRMWTTGDGTADGSGLDVLWKWDYAGRDDAESFDTSYTTASFSAETYTTTDSTTLHEITVSVAVGSFTANDWLAMRFWRDADNASDTYDGDAHVLLIVMEWPVE